MKQLLLFALLLTNLFVSAQTYSLQQSTETYEAFTGTDPNDGWIWFDETWDMPLGFEFPVFDSSITNVMLNSNGHIELSIGGDEVRIGLTRIELADGAFLIDSLAWNNIPIPVYYKTDGTAGNHIFKVQWKGANLWGGDSTDILNYQIWLHESTGDIEMKFGEVNLSTKPTISVHKFKSGVFYEDGFALAGDPTAADTIQVREQTLSVLPETGAVYKWVRGSAPVNPTGLKEMTNTEMSVYPNPVNESTIVEVTKAGQYDLVSITGQRIKTLNLSGRDVVDFSELSPGSYFLIGEDLKKLIVRE